MAYRDSRFEPPCLVDSSQNEQSNHAVLNRKSTILGLTGIIDAVPLSSALSSVTAPVFAMRIEIALKASPCGRRPDATQVILKRGV